jgi:hypothetical protein
MFCSLFVSNHTRTVPHARPFVARRLALLLLVLLPFSATQARAQQSDGIDVQSVNLAGFQIVGNVLKAEGTVTGTIAGLPFTTRITDFALQAVQDDPATLQVECSVLHLELAPINLNLLGLHVDTSAICLDLTATPGGGLLGDLLCGLAGGGILGTGIPSLPTVAQVNTLQTGLIALLDGSLGQNLSPADASAAQQSVCSGDCEILELVLGPLNLSLLGLNVSLDDCADGPVQVCISASRGEGLLGNLLCGLSGADVINLTLADIATLNRRATALAADGQLSRRDVGELTALLGRLIRS